MRAEILATGYEILTGALVDSNSAYLAQQLELVGLEVYRHQAVGDDFSELRAILLEIGQRADLALVTGGLGPTTDDLTASAVAVAAGRPLELDENSLTAIEDFFMTRNRPMTPSNRKQAMIPRGSIVLNNEVGTAPGFALKLGKCWFYFMPGVPGEMRKMFFNQVLPHIKKTFGRQLYPAEVRTITTFGMPESEVGEKAAGVEDYFPGIKLGLRANFPEIQVKLYCRMKEQGAMEYNLPRQRERLADAAKWVCSRLGYNVVSDQGLSLAAAVGQLLKKAGARLAVAESCTGGLIANMITAVAGCSEYFLGGVVAYDNDVKSEVLNVDPELIADHGAVSEAVVEQMASGVRRLTGADLGVATSGVAGPSGGSPEKPVGTVCIGLASSDEVCSKKYHLFFGSRDANKTIFAAVALNRVRLFLMQKRGNQDSCGL